MRRLPLVKSDRKHMIGTEVPVGGSSCAKCRFFVRPRYCSLAMWVNAPVSKGGGSGNPEIPLPPNRFCCDGYEMRSRKNPVREKNLTHDLDWYLRFRPFETWLTIGAGVAVVGGLVYWATRSSASSGSGTTSTSAFPTASTTPMPSASATGQSATPVLPPGSPGSGTIGPAPPGSPLSAYQGS